MPFTSRKSTTRTGPWAIVESQHGAPARADCCNPSTVQRERTLADERPDLSGAEGLERAVLVQPDLEPIVLPARLPGRQAGPRASHGLDVRDRNRDAGLARRCP